MFRVTSSTLKSAGRSRAGGKTSSKKTAVTSLNAFSATPPKRKGRCANPCSDKCPCGGKYRASDLAAKKLSSKQIMELESNFSAKNYAPIPVVFKDAKNATITDPEGRKYIDFLSAYSAMNQGHCHPRILKVMNNQAKHLTLSARAFYNDVFGRYAQYVTSYFGYDKVLPMNTGAEAVEAAVKCARRWAYERGGVADGQGTIIVAKDNFHGRTTTIISFSNDDEARQHYGPYTPGFVSVPYGDTEALNRAADSLKGKLVGIMLEPIQGEAGVIVPPKGYLQAASAAAKRNGGLFIADEVQTGIARTGQLLAHYADDVRPDIVVLGKALSGGAHPVSAILADANVMDVFTPGSHGSTFGGNPLGCAVAMEALQIVVDEQLCERARVLGERFREALQPLTEFPDVTEVRGRGLLNAIELTTRVPKLAYKICIDMRDNGVLAKPTHGNIIRFSPPLSIPEKDFDKSLKVIEKSFKSVLKTV